MTNFDLKVALEQQQNVVEELSRIIMEKCWDAENMDAGIRYELAALAGGVNGAAKKLLELFDNALFHRINDEAQ